MIVYYISIEEKPKRLENLKFYTDHSSAVSASLEMPGSVYSFEVNDKCDTSSFGMDTIMVFQKDSVTGELKFLVSGNWLEIHEILNIPFYYDPEQRAENFVTMSLHYFNEHYKIVSVKEEDTVVSTAKKDVIVDSVKEEVVDQSIKDSIVTASAKVMVAGIPNKNATVIDEDVLGELFGNSL